MEKAIEFGKNSAQARGYCARSKGDIKYLNKGSTK